MPTVIDDILNKKWVKSKVNLSDINEVLNQTDGFDVYNELTNDQIERMVENKRQVCASTGNTSTTGGTICCIGIACTGGSYCM